jgi:hypothetical protein
MVSPGFAVVIYIFGYQYCIVSSTWQGKESEVNNVMLKVKKIQKETKRQRKKI